MSFFLRALGNYKREMNIKSFFSAAAGPAPQPPPGKFELRFARTTKVEQWDDAQFTDCRPSEADDACDETYRCARRYDCKEGEAPEGFVFPQSLLGKDKFDSVEEANAAANLLVQNALLCPRSDDNRATQEEVCNGDLPHGYQLPPEDSKPVEVICAGTGRGTYSGKLNFFVDPHGADVWTVVSSEFVVRVVPEGEKNAAVASGKAAKQPSAAGKAKAASSSASRGSISKASSSRTTAKKPAVRRGGGGACIVSVPGMSKKEVAALNKQAKKAQAAMRKAWDSD